MYSSFWEYREHTKETQGKALKHRFYLEEMMRASKRSFYKEML